MDREWLENYIAMARECEHRQERLARMKSAEVLPPLQAGNDGSQHTGSSGEHMARSVEKRLEYEEQIAPILAENRRRMRAVEHAVCTLPPRERDILRMRYMDSDTLRPLTVGGILQQSCLAQTKSVILTPHCEYTGQLSPTISQNKNSK